MSKPLQVLRAECRALQSIRRTPGVPLPGSKEPVACAPLPKSSPWQQLLLWPEASHTVLLFHSSSGQPTREAKLRLLAPALRQALGAAAPPTHRRTLAPGILLLRLPGSAPMHGWALTELVLACLAPADASQLRLYWIVA